MGSPENRDYAHFTDQLAQQYANGENVDTGNLTYLRNSSEESRRHYDLLMDRIASMYSVEPAAAPREATVRALGKITVGQLFKQ